MDERLIEVRSREDGGAWTSCEYRGDQAAKLAAIGCEIDVDVVYGEAQKNLRSGS